MKKFNFLFILFLNVKLSSAQITFQKTYGGIGEQKANNLNEITFTDNLFITPNPFNSEITISFPKINFNHLSFSLKTILGETILNNQELNLHNTKTIDLSFLSKGVYLLDAIIDGERTVKKIVKE